MSLEYINIMKKIPVESLGYDIIIVTTNSFHEASYWQRRLNSTRGIVSNKDCHIFSVFEDWKSEDGAGNLLGTLYAWRKASKVAYENKEISLIDELKSGKSVAIYHIAGIGTRLAPLPSSECNSKSAVKMPCLISTGNETCPMTVLEAVILQTGPFASSRGGRVSVWWGDQIFIPSCYESKGAYHIEMLAKKMRVSRDLESYGLIIVDNSGEVKLREKMKLEQIIQCIQPDCDGERYANISLGSFSISAALLESLLLEFDEELNLKRTRLNTDAHLWQPITSSQKEYAESGRPAWIWERIMRFWEKFEELSASLNFGKIGYIDIGESYWWDFGNIRFYQENLLKIIEDTEEGDIMRRFFEIPSFPICIKDSDVGSTHISNSLVIGSSIKSGSITNSVIINSFIKEVHIDHCIIIESAVKRTLKGSFSISYRNLEEEDLFIGSFEAFAGIYIPPSTRFRLTIKIAENGKENWRNRVMNNPLSFYEVWQILKGVDRKEQEVFFNEERNKLIRCILSEGENQ